MLESDAPSVVIPSSTESVAAVEWAGTSFLYGAGSSDFCSVTMRNGSQPQIRSLPVRGVVTVLSGLSRFRVDS